MDFGTFLWFTGAVFLTLATFSFLYKDNPFYKVAEHLVVGVSAGYFVIILWHNGLVPKLFQPLSDGDFYLVWLNSSEWYRVIPAILGVMMWTRFSKDYQWVSRWPMSMYIGLAVGVSIPLDLGNRVIRQLQATMYDIKWESWDEFLGRSDLYYVLDPFSGLSQVIVAIGALSALMYFFFSKAHTGVFGRVATFGIWVLMIGFGASFGFTVMARISLFINRVQDVDSWREVAWNAGDTPIEGYSGWYQLVAWLLVAGILAYIVNEIRLYLRNREQVARPQG